VHSELQPEKSQIFGLLSTVAAHRRPSCNLRLES
jgi:hypothetical protein